MFQSSKCIGCFRCIETCKKQAVYFEDGMIKTNRTLCDGCGQCASICTPGARVLTGEVKTVDEVYFEVNKDRLFYETSGGGVTLTGGEVLYQPKFALGILKKCQESGIHTVIETCGFANQKVLAEILQYVDLVLYDVKHMSDEHHKQCTGVGNQVILENLAFLSKELEKPVIVRMPVIPGYNDSDENLHSMGRFLAEHVPTCLEVNLLAYHNMGEGKRELLEENSSIFSSHTPSDQEMEEYRNIIKSYGLVVK